MPAVGERGDDGAGAEEVLDGEAQRGRGIRDVRSPAAMTATLVRRAARSCSARTAAATAEALRRPPSSTTTGARRGLRRRRRR